MGSLLGHANEVARNFLAKIKVRYWFDRTGSALYSRCVFVIAALYVCDGPSKRKSSSQDQLQSSVSRSN